MLETEIVYLTLAGMLMGGWAICWVRNPASAAQARWGRRLFLGACIELGGCALLAAVQQAQGLTVLGLALGLLVAALLWEAPASLSAGKPVSPSDQF